MNEDDGRGADSNHAGRLMERLVRQAAGTAALRGISPFPERGHPARWGRIKRRAYHAIIETDAGLCRLCWGMDGRGVTFIPKCVDRF